MGSFFQFSIMKIGTLCFLPSPLCGEMGGRGLKHCKTQYFWHLDFRRGFPGAQEAQAASQLLPVWVHYLGSMLPWGVCSTTLPENHVKSLENHSFFLGDVIFQKSDPPEAAPLLAPCLKKTKITNKDEHRTILSRKSQEHIAREGFEATELREGSM